MIVKAVTSSFTGAPREVLDSGWHIDCDPHLTVGNQYDVKAISIFHKVIYFQIVDDTNGITWLPSFLFVVSDGRLAPDWCCNLLDPGHLVIGPDFICNNAEAYRRMVELEPDQVAMFYERLSRLPKGVNGSTDPE